MSKQSEREERAAHHVALWLANDYGLYCMIRNELADLRKKTTNRAKGIRLTTNRVLPTLEGRRFDGYKATYARVAAYVAGEWDEADLQAQFDGS